MGRARGQTAALATDSFAAVFGTRRSTWQPKLIDDVSLHQEIAETANGTLTRWFVRDGGPLHRDHGPAVIVEGSSRVEEWYQQGVLHRDGGPSHVEIDANSGRREESWHFNGLLHRQDGPARIIEWADGSRQEIWADHGDWHRLDGPADRYIGADGSSSDGWYYHGARHNENGPARIEIDADGSFTEEWYMHDRLGRSQPGPTRRTYEADNQRLTEEYVNEHGELHREDGPAQRICTGNEGDDGFDSIEERWHVHGILGREDGPSSVITARDGSRTEIWYNSDEELHREDGPAWVKTYADGSRREEWFLRGQPARHGGKPVVLVSADGTVTEQDPWHSH